MRIVADKDIPHAADWFTVFGEVRLVAGRDLKRADLAGADALLVRSTTVVDKALLDGTAVRYVGSATAGIDHIDRDFLEDRGIEFFHAPGCNANAVAEFVAALALRFGIDRGVALDGLGAGIVGYGHVGRRVAVFLERLGMNVVVNDPPLAEVDPSREFVPLAKILAQDLVTLHVPLTEHGPHRTRRLLGAGELAQLRYGALLINTARGGVVDEAALLRHLSDDHGRMAALDCWCDEPRIERDLLERVFVATPHIAGHTVDARTSAARVLFRRLAERLNETCEPCERSEDVSTVSIDPGVRGHTETIRAAVLACCDPRKADVALRLTSTMSGTDGATYFDELRRRFGTRREFGHYAIATARLGADTVATLEELGFRTHTAYPR